MRHPSLHACMPPDGGAQPPQSHARRSMSFKERYVLPSGATHSFQTRPSVERLKTRSSNPRGHFEMVRFAAAGLFSTGLRAAAVVAQLGAFFFTAALSLPLDMICCMSPSRASKGCAGSLSRSRGRPSSSASLLPVGADDGALALRLCGADWSSRVGACRVAALQPTPRASPAPCPWQGRPLGWGLPRRDFDPCHASFSPCKTRYILLPGIYPPSAPL